MTRKNIYYWKCDNPLSIDAKKSSYFKDKYDRPDLNDIVLRACREALGDKVQRVEPLRVDGNHIAFIIHQGEQRLFFRADDGSGDDDYMLAESALMRMAQAAGVAVPSVIHTDTSLKHCPLRFQIMTCCSEPSLSVHHQQSVLDVCAIAKQLGQQMRHLHSVELDGFGFVDTRELAESGHVRGLDHKYSDYFYKRLDDHLDYLRRFELLSESECEQVLGQFRRHSAKLERSRGVLVHRDLALWNVLGTPERIVAIIDWDDAVSGDPADDLGMLQCFYGESFMNELLRGYFQQDTASTDFMCRLWIHTLRNMLWKTMLRHALGYFDKGADFFLNTPEVQTSLKEHTLERLHMALDKVRSFESP